MHIVLICCVVRINNTYLTRSSADVDNGLDAFSGQSRSTNSIIPYVTL